MKQQLTTLEIYYLVKEFQILNGSRLDKIFQIGKEEFYFEFFLTGKGKKTLKITPSLIYFTISERAITEPPNFCMTLRKNLRNFKIKSVKQIGSERIIEFEFYKQKDQKKIIVELFGGGNLILIDENNRVLSASSYHTYKDRSIKPKIEYKLPQLKTSLYKIKQEEFFTKIENSNKENIVKAMAIDLGLGGVYSEELCELSGVNKNKILKKLNENEMLKLYKSMNEIYKKKIDAKVYYKEETAVDVVPFPLKIYNGKVSKDFESFSSALDYFFEIEDIKPQKKATKSQIQIEKKKRIVKNQEKTITSLKKKEKENRIKAETIYNNYQKIKEVINDARIKEKENSQKENKKIEEKSKEIKKINKKTKEILISLD